MKFLFSTDSPILGYHSNIQKSFEVKCILMEDYEVYRKHTDILEKNGNFALFGMEKIRFKMIKVFFI